MGVPKKLARSSFFSSRTHWFFIEFIRTETGFAAFVLAEKPHVGEVASAAAAVDRAAVVRDCARYVPALPACVPQTPAEIDVLLVHVEALVQAFAGYGDVLERLPARDERGAADAEHLLLAFELTDVPLVLSAIRDPPVPADRQPGRVDDVCLMVGRQVVAEDLPARTAGAGTPFEEQHELVEVALQRRKDPSWRRRRARRSWPSVPC